MTGELALLHLTTCKCRLHFNDDKTSHNKQRQFNCCFRSLFYFLSIISAFVANIMSFIEALFRLRICLSRYVFCRRESTVFSKTWYCSTVLPLLLLTMVSVNHIYCRQIARFHFVCPTHRGCLSWVKFVKIPNHKLPSSTRALCSGKARCFSQSECALYGNFIIQRITSLVPIKTRSSRRSF